MADIVRDQKYRYIRNYMPYRIYGQHLEYLWKAPSIRSWEQAYLDGTCNKIQSVFNIFYVFSKIFLNMYSRKQKYLIDDYVYPNACN